MPRLAQGTMKIQWSGHMATSATHCQDRKQPSYPKVPFGLGLQQHLHEYFITSVHGLELNGNHVISYGENCGQEDSEPGL